MTTPAAATIALTLLAVCVPSLAAPGIASQTTQPTFRSAVDRVSVAAVVRDKRGRLARNLGKEDFVVEEAGARHEILEFHVDGNAPVRVALLFDVSGSMRLATRLENARQAARHVLASLRLTPPDQRDGAAGASADPSAGGSRQPHNDEVAVFSFDMNLQSVQPFTADADAIESALARVQPYGQTSLYDAIASTSRRVAERSPGDTRRRAVVVFTDGLDTSSRLMPAQVSAIASEIDVPVYVVTVVSQVDRDRETVDAPEGPLRALARWTGGEMFVTSSPAHESVAARQIVDELRHQYVLAFNASPAKGWHPLDVKTKDRDLTVRARSGYAAGARAGS